MSPPSFCIIRSWDSVVGIATGYGLEDRGVGVGVLVGSGVFSSPRRLGPTQPPMQGVLRALYSVVKWQGRENYHSPTTSAEVKKMLIYTSILN
jgi:hypothetical protein